MSDILSPNEIEHRLQSHMGSLERFQTMSKEVIYTPGVKDMAEMCGAYWLIDAIMAHISCNPDLGKKMRTDERLQYMQFWHLDVDDNKARLTCLADSGEEPAVTQDIEFTDFPLSEIDIWAGYDGQIWTIYLPSEH